MKRKTEFIARAEEVVEPIAQRADAAKKHRLCGLGIIRALRWTDISNRARIASRGHESYVSRLTRRARVGYRLQTSRSQRRNLYSTSLGSLQEQGSGSLEFTYLKDYEECFLVGRDVIGRLKNAAGNGTRLKEGE